MKRFTLILLLAALLSSCGGGDGGSAPADISGTWYGDGYVSGYYVEVAYIFHPLEQGYYRAVAMFAALGSIGESYEQVVQYHNGVVEDIYRVWGTVKGDYMVVFVLFEVEPGGPDVSGYINLYRQ